jgi:gamma-glutamylcyclotransferase (GGCT)/AIG2-like uncharacterized protein YtfP
MKLYFAYGSNMWESQMNMRCPESKKLGIAQLSGYRWIISARGYANVVKSEDDYVLGVLYEISTSDESSLDRYEGVSAGFYTRAMLRVVHSSKEREALVYVDPVTDEGEPVPEYIDRINFGLADAKLSPDYVGHCIRKFVPK